MAEFLDQLHDVFSSLGEVRVRAMFGGHGVYHGDTMFALVADDVLYLKCDDENRAQFEARDLGPFTWESPNTGTKTMMSYWQAPDEIFDDTDAAREWTASAWAAAGRAQAKKKPRPGK